MVWYREITLLQEPFDLGSLDDQNRAVYIFNVMAVKVESNTFIEELTKLLEAAGVGTRNTNIFATSAVAIPSGSGPYLVLIETGGTSPLRFQTGGDYQRPTAKLTVHGLPSAAARVMAQAARNALAPVRNQYVNP